MHYLIFSNYSKLTSIILAFSIMWKLEIVKNANGRADIKNVLAVAEIDISKTVMKQNGIRAANNRPQTVQNRKD